jgi:hypothetical protein
MAQSAIGVLTIVLVQFAVGTLNSAIAQTNDFKWSPTRFPWSGTNKVPPSVPDAIAAGDVNAVLFNWMWYLGMIRGTSERDSVAMFELWKSTGTMRLDEQPCKLTNYRLDINYQVSGLRARYACTLPNGQVRNGIEVVSGQYAWDEDMLGAGLVPGNGTATPRPDARNERLVRLWASPWGAPKAAVWAGPKTKVAMEAGKPVVTFPLPDVEGATAKATLNSQNQAERVEVRLNNTLTEFTYENYGDWNPADDKVMGYTPRHIVEKRNGVVIRDINVVETEVGNLYVVMPVPDNVKNQSLAKR